MTTSSIAASGSPEYSEWPLRIPVKHRSEGVRKGFRTVLKAEKVVGVGSLAVFLGKSLSELSCILVYYYSERAYCKSTLSTWATVERRKRLSREWYQRYWMPAEVRRAFWRLIRETVRYWSGGRYAARITGNHRWRVELRRMN